MLRLTTKILAWDVTFLDLVGKTLEDKESGTKLDRAAIIYDMYGRVLCFAFVERGEQHSDWKRLMFGLHDWCAFLKISEDVVKHGYSDVGDENYKDVNDQWFVQVWPKVSKSPMKDIFHAMTIVTGPKSVHANSHDLHPETN